MPSPMSRSVTCAHLQCAASLLRDGYCTTDEVSRLRNLVHDAANVDMRIGEVVISADESAGDVADVRHR